MEQLLRIDPGVGVSDQLERDRVDAGITAKGTIGELRELLVVTLREVLTHLSNLVGDDVNVIEQPGGRGCWRLVLSGTMRETGPGGHQDPLVRVDRLSNRRAAYCAPIDAVLGGERPSSKLELIGG